MRYYIFSSIFINDYIQCGSKFLLDSVQLHQLWEHRSSDARYQRRHEKSYRRDFIAGQVAIATKQLSDKAVLQISLPKQPCPSWSATHLYQLKQKRLLGKQSYHYLGYSKIHMYSEYSISTISLLLHMHMANWF